MTSWNPTAEDPPSEDVRELADGFTEGSVLDVGCGTSRNLKPFDRPGFKLYGVDNNPTAVAASKTRFRNHEADAVLIELCDLRIYQPKQRFDIVLCYGVLHFLTLKDRANAYKRLRSWVNPGGLISIVMFNQCVPVPEDLRLSMPEVAADSNEILSVFADWLLIKHRSYVYDDEHDGGRLHHTHSIDRVLARNSAPVGGS